MIDFFSRLDIYMKFKGLNDNKITIETGISNGLIGKARKRGALSQENISKILHRYPELDANWLLTGNGDMLKTNLMAESINKVSEPERKPPDDKDQMIIELQQHRIVSLEKDLKEREREIDQLKKELAHCHSLAMRPGSVR